MSGAAGAGSDLSLIVRAARAAGAEALSRQKSGLAPEDIRAKAGGEPVTAADLAANEILKDMLLDARPDYGWLSEESADDPARMTARRTFIIDPIDGTRAFMRGQDDYVVSVAVVEDGRPVAGALYQPARDALWEAEPGGGARRNGAPLTVRDRAALAGAKLVCPAGAVHPRRWRTPWPEDLEIGYRNSMAYRIAMVACGDWHGALALSGKNDWDLAAADLIVSESGGVITGLDGAPFRYNEARTRKPGVVCGAPEFHAALMRRLEDWRQDGRDGQRTE